MTTAADIVWAAVKEKLFCTREQFEAQLKLWELKEIWKHGELVAVVMIKGDEIHCAATEGHWVQRSMAQWLRPGMKTAVFGNNAKARKFVERIGFRLENEDTHYAYYSIPEDVLESGRHARLRQRNADRRP